MPSATLRHRLGSSINWRNCTWQQVTRSFSWPDSPARLSLLLKNAICLPVIANRSQYLCLPKDSNYNNSYHDNFRNMSERTPSGLGLLKYSSILLPFLIHLIVVICWKTQFIGFRGFSLAHFLSLCCSVFLFLLILQQVGMSFPV